MASDKPGAIHIKALLEGDAGFPCVSSKNAFKKGRVLFHFVESLCPTGIGLLAEAPRDFVEVSIKWDGTLATSFPLVVSFADKTRPTNCLEIGGMDCVRQTFCGRLALKYL